MDGVPKVVITHQALEGEWLIRLPEFVGVPDAALFYTVAFKDRVEWKEYDDGEIGYDYQPAPESVGVVAQRLDGDLPLIPGVQISARMQPSRDRIDLTLGLANLTAKPIEDVWCEGGCLQHLSTRFHDNDTLNTRLSRRQTG
jgi:hypothetical protein